MKKRLKVLVTGGAGFIGSHIVDEYVAAGYRVVIIDDLSTGSMQNINPAATFYKADIRDNVELERVLRIEKPDIVNHQAAVVSVTKSAARPLESYEVNTIGTINLLLASRGYIKKFILASTGGAMYAKPKKFPAAETEAPTPISPYGFSKQLAEEAVAFYCKQHAIDFTILRYANVFGPRQNPHGESGVIAIFTLLAQQQKQPTIYRKETTRDYVFVGDIARANLLALTKGANQIINIGTGKETSNQKVYEAVAHEFAWQQKPRYEAPRTGELLRSVLSNAKAKKVLGWVPAVSMSEGLKMIRLAIK
jgi:UDP-glucose 4-epimerase